MQSELEQIAVELSTANGLSAERTALGRIWIGSTYIKLLQRQGPLGFRLAENIGKCDSNNARRVSTSITLDSFADAAAFVQYHIDQH